MKDRKVSDGQWDEIEGILQFLEPFPCLLVLHLIRLHSSLYTHKKELIYKKRQIKTTNTSSQDCCVSCIILGSDADTARRRGTRSVSLRDPHVCGL